MTLAEKLKELKAETTSDTWQDISKFVSRNKIAIKGSAYVTARRHGFSLRRVGKRVEVMDLNVKKFCNGCRCSST